MNNISIQEKGTRGDADKKLGWIESEGYHGGKATTIDKTIEKTLNLLDRRDGPIVKTTRETGMNGTETDQFKSEVGVRP